MRQRIRALTPILGIALWAASGCAYHSTWSEEKTRVVSHEGEPHLLEVTPSTSGVSVRLQLRGGKQTRIQDFRVRGCGVSFESYTSEYPYLFPVTIPLDLLLLPLSLPVAGVEHLLADTSDELLPERSLAPGELANPHLSGDGVLYVGDLYTSNREIYATFSGYTSTATLPWNVSLYFLSAVIGDAARKEDRLGRVRATVNCPEGARLTFEGRIPLDQALALWEPIALAHEKYPGGKLQSALGGNEVPESQALRDLLARLKERDHETYTKEAKAEEREAKRKAAEEKRKAELAAHTCAACGGSGIASQHVETTHVFNSPLKKDWVENTQRITVWTTARERDRGTSGGRTLTFGSALPRLTKDYGIDVDDLRYSAKECLDGTFSVLYRSYVYPALCKHCRGSGDPLEKGPEKR